MAKFKSSPSAAEKAPAARKSPTAKRPATKTAASKKASPTNEVSSRSIMDSAQLIWQSGVKAMGRAQQEGTRLFETLVKEGAGIEKKTRKLATGKVGAVRDSVENRVESVKGRATDTWDRLEKVFEERVQRALTRLGVPARDELQGLINRVDELNQRLRDLGASSSKTEKTKQPASKKAPTKAKTETPNDVAAPAAKKVAVKKAVTPKAAKSDSDKPTSVAKKTAPAKKAKSAVKKPTSTPKLDAAKTADTVDTTTPPVDINTTPISES